MVKGGGGGVCEKVMVVGNIFCYKILPSAYFEMFQQYTNIDTFSNSYFTSSTSYWCVVRSTM